ncbi:MAG: DUF885 domain-containing protein [Vicinamibacteria bacterium]|nr:DUF885 domain-containing protein [Vicinamibacteria bacterium]
MVLLSAGASAQERERLHALFGEAWEFRLAEDPLLATSVGDRRGLDRLPSVAAADIERQRQAARTYLARLAAVDLAQLSAEDRTNALVFRRQWQDALAEIEFGFFRLPINADSGFHTGVAFLPTSMPLATTADYEAYVARLRAIPEYFKQQTEHLKTGLRDGFTQPQVVMKGYEGTISAHVVDDVEQSLFDAPFKNFPAGVPEADRARLREAGRAAIRDAVIPAYRELLLFFTKEYLPGGRTTLGASEWPRGRELYAHLVKSYTTMDVTPDQVHETGLAEVARIRAEMEQVIAKSGFEGDFAAFLKFLREDPRFYPKTAQELLERASFLAKKIDGALPRLFRTLPRLPYAVEPVPDHIAPKYTGGRYVEGAADGTRAGIYWVNTYALNTRTLYTLEALTLHEAVPGHHLQIALQQELKDLPPFRRFAGTTAFVEGWALYAERLGLEAGFYQDPYSDFGRLTYEMWRACRLVVDTGLHWKGWTREQALDFLASNTALSLHEVTTETDRYISWPGQALAYKMGELKIRELRARAERQLGSRFDVRAFHDAVLLGGPLPMDALDARVDAWIAEAEAGR